MRETTEGGTDGRRDRGTGRSIGDEREAVFCHHTKYCKYRHHHHPSPFQRHQPCPPPPPAPRRPPPANSGNTPPPTRLQCINSKATSNPAPLSPSLPSPPSTIIPAANPPPSGSTCSTSFRSSTPMTSLLALHPHNHSIPKRAWTPSLAGSPTCA